ncbi:CRISPR-associated protein Cas4 [Parabacteroides sp. Marseille-P3160]|uniref:CRISPR-associated protein Cas4 n=1 Tax=Parabacteroides sp. Marseille-P3160 TaxID=1917887 RepID=UPI0009BBB4EE|nr:CRISPR-associated protein Cas4 [Parabacteroides sp. Marseille-P3160]
MHINATLIDLYHVCKRECWLHANGINMEQTSETVYDGKLIHETSYADRSRKYNEIDVSAQYHGIDLYGKIDFYDTHNRIIHETKRSDKAEKAHEWQVKYYMWLLQLNGIQDVSAILEYPQLRQTSQIELTENDIEHLKNAIIEITQLKDMKECPPTIKKPICKNCSYYELCYINEE